jgi:hypothetical protein
MPRYCVSPRYSPGSPADVHRVFAEQAARDEVTGYERALAGRYGPELEARAHQLGLAGIVEVISERRGKLEIQDLITGASSSQSLPERHHEVLTRRQRSAGAPLVNTYV